jgi:broad specificity phosphatase PhoE
MKLLWIRHAESVGNRERRLPTLMPDPLTDLGKEQAQQLALYLQRRSWVPTHLYSSPLQRTMQTAEILQQSLMRRSVTNAQAIELRIHSQLQEIHQGILAGLTWAEAQAEHPALCQRLESTLELLTIPGAELPEQVQQRTENFLQTLFVDHQNQDRLWLVTHGGVLLYFLANLLGSPRVWGLTVPNTSLFEFELDRERWDEPEQYCNSSLWRIGHFNATPHLQSAQ